MEHSGEEAGGQRRLQKQFAVERTQRWLQKQVAVEAQESESGVCRAGQSVSAGVGRRLLLSSVAAVAAAARVFSFCSSFLKLSGGFSSFLGCSRGVCGFLGLSRIF